MKAMLFPINLDESKRFTRVDFSFPPELAMGSLAEKNSAIKGFLSKRFGDKRGRRKEWIEYNNSMVYKGNFLLCAGDDRFAPTYPVPATEAAPAADPDAAPKEKPPPASFDAATEAAPAADPSVRRASSCFISTNAA